MSKITTNFSTLYDKNNIRWYFAEEVDDYVAQQEKNDKLLDLYRKQDKIRNEMYESVSVSVKKNLLNLLMICHQEIDKLESELK